MPAIPSALRLHGVGLLATLGILGAAETSPAVTGAELTNYRSGISLVIQGRHGQDYVVERFYHDPLIDDHGVIHIRSGVKLALEHNERNTWVSQTRPPFRECGVDGPDGKPGSGDEGQIRYKVDRDQQLGISWSNLRGKTPNPMQPAYTAPFSWSELEFEPGVKVLGNIGPKPGAAMGPGFYYRGLKDAWGDEWHTLTVADDDAAFQDNTRKQSTDGKIFLFVIDPKTPCLSLRTRTPQAQFYTTPAKTYFLPRLHEQTTYLTDGVEVVLTSLVDDGGALSYRLDGGPTKAYTTPLRSEDLTDGRHVLECWIGSGPRKTRTIVKNPPHPSRSETHPRLLWADQAELDGIKARLQREPYKGLWDACHGDKAAQAGIDKTLGRGGRGWVGGAMVNALVAHFDGVQAKAPNATQSYAAYAKRVLLDNKLNLDPVGFELAHHADPIPTPEWNYFGYWVVNEVFDLAFAYDLLIGSYRSDQTPGGITPIEDLKIRDGLAHWIAVQLLDLRGCEGSNERERQPAAGSGDGMWDTARLCGAAAAAMAMPAYDTAYYGTSGFDNTTRARHTDVPFVGQAFTWKELFIDADQPVAATPKLRRRFNPFDGGLIKADGNFHDRSPYFSYPLMGHCFVNLANTAKLTCGKTWPYLDKAFQRALEGTLEGGKVTHPSDKGGKRHILAELVNPRFPVLGAQTQAFIAKEPPTGADGKRNLNSAKAQLEETFPFGLLWYQDDLQFTGAANTK